ncbi:MAG TPA: mechanosensitive ion channel domain-containing protein [Terriglobia bacterium]|nr:mechanosensitive ion channel domain-containing protein [Terriglobia bacterium]
MPDPIQCGVHAARCRLFNRLWTRLKYVIFLALASVLSAGPVWGQKLLQKAVSNQPPAPQTTPTPPPQEVPQDPLGRDSPYGTVVGFLKAAESDDWARGADFLDSKQAAPQKQELARQLKLVLDRGLSLDLDTVSKNPEGVPQEQWRKTRNEIGTARIADQSLVILLDRVEPTAKRPPYWLFSAETLNQVPELARNLEAPWFEAYIPKALVENRFLGIPVFRWILIPLVISIAFCLVLLITAVLGFAIRGVFRLLGTSPVVLRAGFLGPLRVLILAYLVFAAAPLAQTLVARQIWRDIVAQVVAILGFAWLLARTLDLVTDVAVARLRRTNSLFRIAHLRLARWVLKAVVAVIALVAILYKTGINPTTVVTGLGLGGVALAFAAQKTIENVFGTIMIVADQPLRVGDFCKIGDSLGTIEDIGLRSTRVRTLNHTLLTVPNGQLASMIVENYASRQRIWFRHVIGLRYETTADQLRYVLEEVRKLLREHPKVEPNDARVRLIRFGGSSLDLEIFAYVPLADYAAFLEVQEELLLRIMDIIERAGTGIALPSQTTYLAEDSRLGAEKRQEIIERVHGQKEQEQGDQAMVS